MSDVVLYPIGYGTDEGTIDEVLAELTAHGHPEFVRRLRAWLISKGGLFGIGDAWRAVQPVKAGFAAPGKSFHQDQRFASGFVGCAAVDLVIRRKNATHSSGAIPWALVPRQGTSETRVWGLHCNVEGEPWHMQPTEFDGWQRWANSGRPDPVAGYSLPTVSGDSGAPPAPPAPQPPVPIPQPSKGHIIMLTALAGFPTINPGASGPWVKVWQSTVNVSGAGLDVDGDYGPKSQNVCKYIQGLNGLPVTGVIDLATWAVSFPK